MVDNQTTLLKIECKRTSFNVSCVLGSSTFAVEPNAFLCCFISSLLAACSFFFLLRWELVIGFLPPVISQFHAIHASDICDFKASSWLFTLVYLRIAGRAEECQDKKEKWKAFHGFNLPKSASLHHIESSSSEETVR